MNTTQLIREFWQSLVHFAYPNTCLCCNNSEPLSDDIFCLDCSLDLPYTTFFQDTSSDMKLRLSSRFDLCYAMAIFYFFKDGKVQDLMHNLKYRRKSAVGKHLGSLFGHLWQENKELQLPDLVIPVPLHEKRQFQRGYNQSYVFGKAIADQLNIPIYNVLKKVKHTESQTKKSREARIANIKNTIRVNWPFDLKGKHILLVDDVLTTGATLEICAKIIQDYEPSCTLSVGTLAMAETI